MLPDYGKPQPLRASGIREYWGVDMALYYNPDEPAIVPDAFLALGVDRLRNS